MKEEENKLQSQLAQQREECKETECENQHYENHLKTTKFCIMWGRVAVLVFGMTHGVGLLL